MTTGIGAQRVEDLLLARLSRRVAYHARRLQADRITEAHDVHADIARE